MFRYLFFCITCVVAAQMSADTSNWPQARTNNYEILGGFDLGVLIPVADYQFKGRDRSSDPVVWLNAYEHVEDPNTKFTLIFDPFDDPCDVETFAQWCLLNDNFMDMHEFLSTAELKRREDLMAGKKKDIPVIRFVSEYQDLIVDQVFLTVGNYGYCLLATYPAKEEKTKSKYWDFFFSNTLPYIERVE